MSLWKKKNSNNGPVGPLFSLIQYYSKTWYRGHTKYLQRTVQNKQGSRHLFCKMKKHKPLNQCFLEKKNNLLTETNFWTLRNRKMCTVINPLVPVPYLPYLAKLWGTVPGQQEREPRPLWHSRCSGPCSGSPWGQRSWRCSPSQTRPCT